MTMDEHVDCDRQLNEAEDRIVLLNKVIANLNERIKKFEDFLRNLIVIDNMLCLLPTPAISKDILPKQGREDSVILLTCDKTSSPELFMKMIDTVLSKTLKGGE